MRTVNTPIHVSYIHAYYIQTRICTYTCVYIYTYIHVQMYTACELWTFWPAEQYHIPPSPYNNTLFRVYVYFIYVYTKKAARGARLWNRLHEIVNTVKPSQGCFYDFPLSGRRQRDFFYISIYIYIYMRILYMFLYFYPRQSGVRCKMQTKGNNKSSGSAWLRGGGFRESTE